MVLPDFTDAVLTYLSEPTGWGEDGWGDGFWGGGVKHWDTDNFSPHPTLIDGDEWSNHADSSRARSIDIATADIPIITVDSNPLGQNEVRGHEYNFNIRHGVRVICEGYHTDGGGQVDNVDDFGNMVQEARRAILTERTHPTFGDAKDFSPHHLIINNESNDSPSSGDAHYFRVEFEVWFIGAETLP